VFASIAGWFALALCATVAAADPVTVRLAAPARPAEAGEPWTANVIIAKYGRPLTASAPALRVRQGRVIRVVHAAPTGRRGVYRVRVVFPTAGRWSFEAPFGHTVRRPSVDVGGR
jgi:hypothetical protein